MAKQTGRFERQSPEFLTAEEQDRKSHASKAVGKLVKAGAKLEELEIRLHSIGLNPREKRRYFLHAKEYKAAKAFPGRIEKFADEIRSVNTGSLFYELILFARTGGKEQWVLDDDYRRTLEIFQGLPEFLNSYAKFVEFAIRRKKRKPGITEHFVIDLISYVKRATGKPHYGEIQALLDDVFGGQSPYDARKLQDLWRRTRPHLSPLFISAEIR